MNNAGAQARVQDGILLDIYEDPGAAVDAAEEHRRIKYRRILLLECGTVSPDRSHIPYIPAGTEVLLERVPEYPDDRWAIRVSTQDGRALGFLPFAKNQSVARLMDAGKRIVCVRVNPFDEEFHPALGGFDNNENKGCALRIYMEIPVVEEEEPYEPIIERSSQ